MNPLDAADLASADPLPSVLTDGDDDAATPDTVAATDEVETRLTVVDAAGHGLRLDKWLVQVAPEFSRSHLQGLIEAGAVRLGGPEGPALAQASKRVSAGQRIAVSLLPTAQSAAFRAEPMALSVVWEDEALLVVDKPVGLVVHPAAGHWSGTLLNGLLAHHEGALMLPRAGIVHRLDKDTSGLMVVAKTLAAHTALVRAIAAREVKREYLALVHGQVPEALASIESPIGRDPASRVRMAVVASGKPARTDLSVLATFHDPVPPVRSVLREGMRSVRTAISAVRCRLHTGRTHQIRVHLASQGHPLVGDALYGGEPRCGVQRQALHATFLALAHPLNGQWMEWNSPLPADLAPAWQHVLA